MGHVNALVEEGTNCREPRGKEQKRAGAVLCRREPWTGARRWEGQAWSLAEQTLESQQVDYSDPVSVFCKDSFQFSLEILAEYRKCCVYFDTLGLK